MKHTRLLLLYLFTSLISTIHATDSDIFRNIAPSPNAAALAQYAEFPVSLYSGTPSISIPLYTIQTGSHSLPVSLNYHASGIKVAQEASWVGLGWSLSAGGIITRTIRGSDDFNGGYYDDATAIPDTTELTYSNEYVEYKEMGASHASLFLKKDAEPDVFYYNFSGYSGKFYCKKGGKFRAQGDGFILSNPEHNLKIERVIQGTTFLGFTITTPEGTKYRFLIAETKKIFSYSQKGGGMSDKCGAYCTMLDIDAPTVHETEMSWYLDRIDYPDGHKIYFDYYEDRNSYLSPVSVSQTYYDYLTYRDYSYGTVSVPNLESEVAFTLNLTTIEPRLKRIRWESGYLDFVGSRRYDVRNLSGHPNYPSYDRCDPPQKLDKIKLFQNGVTEPLKTFNFYYSYFLSDGTFTPEYLTSRLKLDSISAKGKSERTHKYRMGYDLNHPLPAKNSFSCDLWGYYNAKNNQCFYPSYVAPKSYYDMSGLLQLEIGATKSGSDRAIAREYVTSSMLTSLATPEGGTTEFKYEANEVMGAVTNWVVGEGKHEGWMTINNPYAFGNYGSGSFTMPSDGYIDVSYAYSGGSDLKYKLGSITLASTNPHLFTISAKDFGDPDPDGSVLHEIYRVKKNKIACKKGKYGVFSITWTSEAASSSLRIDMYSTEVFTGQQAAPGVRIAEIKSPISTKKYIYNDEKGVSTGILVRQPSNCRRVIYAVYNVNPNYNPQITRMAGYKSYLKRYSDSFTSLESPVAGVSLGYSKVSIATTSKNEELLEEKYFYNQKEISDSRTGFPGEIIPTNGKLKAHYIYSEKQFLQGTKYNYEVKYVDGLKALKQDLEHTLSISGYSIPIYHCRPSQQLDSIVSKSPNVQKTYYTTYKYNELNYQVNKMTKSTSRGIDQIKTIRYSIDLKNISPYKEMCERNLVTVPIETNFLSQRTLNKKELHTYKQNSLNSQYVPDSEYTYYHQKGTSAPADFNGNLSPFGKPELNYDSYDSYGNITSISNKMKQSVVYIWGYNHQYPVAQISNATLSDVVNQGIDMNAIGSSPTPTQVQWNSLHALRDKLPASQVIISTYEPLVGIKSQTDARGVTTYYEYDDLGRLSCIRDNENRIIKTYDYKYSTEQ